VPGVTVLVYDQRCAAESRRLRKRGALPVRRTRVVINEAVCEGCGDCGVKSNCLSVQPVDTEYGRKTRIDQTSCNTDYSCLDGDCPSFVTVEAPERAEQVRPSGRSRPRCPTSATPPEGDVFLAGIGGTGIVTVNQVLGSAAVRDGLAVHGVDQTGLSQKAGPVTSHLRIARDAAALGPAVRVGTATAYLAFDVLVGADARHLACADADRTLAVVSTSSVPTGAMVRTRPWPAADTAALVERIGGRVGAWWRWTPRPPPRPCSAMRCPPTCCSSAPPTRRGRCRCPPRRSSGPSSSTAWPSRSTPPRSAGPRRRGRPGRVRRRHLDRPGGRAAPTWDGDLGDLAGETRRLVAVRAAQLVGYQGERTARAYVRDVQAVWRAERALARTSDTRSARPSRAGCTGSPPTRTSTRWPACSPTRRSRRRWPPRCRAGRGCATGCTRRRSRRWAGSASSRSGRGCAPVLRALARGRGLRGTPLDPFGRTEVRRVERALRDEYRAMVLRLAAGLTRSPTDGGRRRAGRRPGARLRGREARGRRAVPGEDLRTRRVTRAAGAAPT
jgi:indolepyruvate ferredoxin oxidoreductase